jgi:hypothetical protein
MYNTKFVLTSGREIYPGYLDKEKRQNLKESFEKTHDYLSCGCRTDIKLKYKISADLKIYPEHNNYEHDKNCCRYKNGNGERQTAYIINDEDGEVTAYLTFDPRAFSLNEETEKEQDNDVPDEIEEDENIEEIEVQKDDDTENPTEKKEPKLSLGSLVRSINVDAFSEKVLNNKIVDSKENFSRFVYFRMKKVKVSRMKKSLGDLSLEKEGVRFLYLPFVCAEVTEIGEIKKCSIHTKGPDGKIYRNFIYFKTLEKALMEYRKAYGKEPDQETMIAGFQYLKTGKNKTKYRVLGRIHLFDISNIGLYCRSNTERDAFNTLNNICKEDPDIKYWIPADDETIGAIISVKGKQKKLLIVFKSKKTGRVSFDSSCYVPFLVEDGLCIDKEYIKSLLEEN